MANNENSQGAALAAITTYATGTGWTPAMVETDTETVVADLLADLHNLCDTIGVDFINAANRADTYYYDPDDEKFSGTPEGIQRIALSIAQDVARSL